MRVVHAVGAFAVLACAEECSNDPDRSSLLQTKTMHKQTTHTDGNVPWCGCQTGQFNAIQNNCHCMGACIPQVCTPDDQKWWSDCAPPPVADGTPTQPPVADGTPTQPPVADGTPTRPPVADGTPTQPPVADGSATVAPPVVHDGNPPDVADGSFTVAPPVVLDGTPPPVADGSSTVAPPASIATGGGSFLQDDRSTIPICADWIASRQGQRCTNRRMNQKNEDEQTAQQKCMNWRERKGKCTSVVVFTATSSPMIMDGSYHTTSSPMIMDGSYHTTSSPMIMDGSYECPPCMDCPVCEIDCSGVECMCPPVPAMPR